MSDPAKIIEDLKTANTKSLEAVKREFLKVRAGKASPQLLDNIRISAYGQVQPLNQLAGVTTPDPRTIVIAPWDKSLLGDIEKAINVSDLGLNPQNDGKVVRLNIPALTEDRRKELVKVVNKYTEEGRVGVRQNRKVANEAIKALEKDKAISEDDSKRQMEKIQQLTDECIKSIDGILEKKTAEIMTI